MAASPGPVRSASTAAVRVIIRPKAMTITMASANSARHSGSDQVPSGMPRPRCLAGSERD